MRRISELPPVGNCPSGLAFVEDSPRAEYGGFIYQNGTWVSIFDLTNVILNAGKVNFISGKLLPQFEVGFNGEWFNSVEVFMGIDCNVVFGYPLPLPLKITYRIIGNGCKFAGQTFY